MNDHSTPTPPGRRATPGPPGSPAAVAAGCSCDIVDNHDGAGVNGQGRQYWVAVGCRVHDEPRGPWPPERTWPAWRGSP